jgi:hypothetical protein
MSSLSHAQFKQLPMFMTPHEVKSEYALWDGDRRYVNNQGKTYYQHHADQIDKAKKAGKPLPSMSRSKESWSKTGHIESDDEMLGRKYREAGRRQEIPNPDWTPESTLGTPMWATTETSLRTHIKKNGVESPLSLEVTNPDQFDRPRLLGGHHRLAVTLKNHPDTLLPVRHFSDISQAQSEHDYT